MDKETLSNYGWIVIAVLVLAVMVALATPFGQFIENGVKSTAQGLFDVNQSAGAIAGLNIPDQEFEGSNSGGSTPSNNIPDGGTYYVSVGETIIGDYTGATATYTAGEAFPDTVKDGDVFVYGDYEYRYNQNWSNAWCAWRMKSTTQNGWNGWGVRVLDNTKETYGAILDSINGQPVTDMLNTFYNCTSLVTAPEIPSSVTYMNNTFCNCTALTTAPAIPSTVTNMSGTFFECGSLETAPVIPSSVTNMPHTFNGCTALTGTIEINATNLTSYNSCFYGTTEPITLTGTCPQLAELAKGRSNITVQ